MSQLKSPFYISLFPQLGLVGLRPETVSILPFPEKSPADFYVGEEGQSLSWMVGRGEGEPGTLTCFLDFQPTFFNFALPCFPSYSALPLSVSSRFTQYNWD